MAEENIRYLSYWLAYSRERGEKGIALDRLTTDSLLPTWFKNLALNIEENRLRQLPDLDTIPKEKGKPAIVIGAGPSLRKYKHLEILAAKAKNFPGRIISTDRVFVEALKAGVRVDYVVSIDASEQVAEFYADPVVAKSEAVMLCDSTVHPSVIRNFPGKKCVFHAYIDDPDADFKSYSQMMRYMSPQCVLLGGGNAGSTGWLIAKHLGMSPVALVGMDLGFTMDTDLSKTPYYSSYKAMGYDDKYIAKNLFRKDHNPDFNNEGVTDYVFDSYVEGMLRYVWLFRDQVETVNCTGGGCLHGPGIKGMPLERFLAKYGGRSG